MYYTLLHAKIKVLGLVVLERIFFFYFSHYKSTGAICCHGNQRPDPTWVLT